jgi:hypothetical protein
MNEHKTSEKDQYRLRAGLQAGNIPVNLKRQLEACAGKIGSPDNSRCSLFLSIFPDGNLKPISSPSVPQSPVSPHPDVEKVVFEDKWVAENRIYANGISRGGNNQSGFVNFASRNLNLFIRLTF